MDATSHPDPVGDAFGKAEQRAVQLASLVGASTQVVMYVRGFQARAAAERDDRVRRALQAQIRAERDAARAGWAPALDPDWLRRAGLLDAGRTWGQAVPYADRNVPWYEPSAAAALRSSEERLRDLHPYAMAWYDRLRDNGAGPLDAMREALPLFTRHPRPQDASSVPRPALGAADAAAPEGTVSALSAGAGDAASPAAAVAVRAPASTSVRLWQRDFPIPIREVVAASVPAPPPAGAGRPAVTRAARPARPAQRP